jgi:hypothetical protein
MNPELHIHEAHVLHPQCKVTPYNWSAPERKVKMLEYAYKDTDLNTRQTKVNVHVMFRRLVLKIKCWHSN